MTFAALSPFAMSLLLAGVLAAVLALYLLRPTPREQVVSNIAFWTRAMEQARPRFLAASRVPIVPLLVSMVAAALLVIDLGDPRPSAGHPGLTVIVVSAGESLGAQSRDGRSRFEYARRAALQEALRETARGEVALVRAGLHPEVLVARTSEPEDIAHGLEHDRPDDGPADLAAALSLAESIARTSRGPARVALVTDLPSHEIPVGTGVSRALLPVGERADTLAFTALGARRDSAAMGEYVVLAEVTAFSERPVRARVVLRDRDTVISEEAVSLAPGERRWLRAQGFSSARAEITATLEGITAEGGRDALAADDRAYGVVEPLARTRVLLVTHGDRYLERVLAVNPAVQLTQITPEGLNAARAGLSRYDVVVLDGVAPSPPIEHPGVLLLGPPTESEVALGPRVSAPRLTGVAIEHRVLDRVRLDDVRVRESHALVTGPEDQILLRGDRQTLMLARSVHGRRLLAVGFDTRGSDLGERVAFPLWMHNSVMWLSREESGWRASRRPGELWVTGPNARVRGPDGRALATHAGVLEETTVAGIYRTAERAVAFCDTDDRRALPVPDVTQGAPRESPAPGVPWRTRVAAMAVVWITLEWFLVHRGRLR